MNLEQTLLENICPTPSFKEMLQHINLPQLEQYVKAELQVFTDSRGADGVRYDLHYDVQTPTDDFITRLMETGSVHLLKENSLLHHSQFIDALYLIISAMNIAVADFLCQQQIANVTSYRYLDADPLYHLLERAVEAVEQQVGSTVVYATWPALEKAS